MYKKLLSTAILGGFGFSSLSLNLVFAQNNSSSDTVKNKNKAKEIKPSLFTGRLCKKLTALNVSNNLFTTDKAIVLLLSFFSKIAVSAAKDYFFNKNEGTELNLEKVNKETNKYFESEVKRSNAGKGFENKELKEENKTVPANKGIDKEKEIAKNLDEENKEKQEIKGAERSDVTNSEEMKNENTEKNDLSKKDNVEKGENLIGLKTKAFSIVILAMVGAIIFYKYLNRAVVEGNQEDGRIVYKIKVDKATKEDIENIRKKAKAGDKIVLIFNFSKTDNAWQEISLKTGELLSTNTENTIPVLYYESAIKLHKIHNNEGEGVFCKNCFGNYNLELNFNVLKDYRNDVNLYKNLLYSSFEKFEETMSIINNVFGQLYRMPSNNYNLSFSHIFCLVNTSYLLDFTYLRDTQNKYDNFLNELLNKEEHYLKLEALTGFLYRDVLDKVEEKRKNEDNEDNVNNSSRYKKISSAINIEDLIKFVDVIKNFNDKEYKIKELKNIKVNMNLVYTSLLEKIVIHIFTNGVAGTIAKRKLYQSEKYEIFKLFENLQYCRGYFNSLEVKDKKLDYDIFKKLKEFLERFKKNTKEYQAPAKFDALTIEELAKVYNEDYIKDKLDIFSGEFWELFGYVKNKHNEKNVGNLENRDKNLFNLISDLENKLVGDNNVKFIIEKIYSGEMFKYVYYDDAVGKIYFKADGKKIPLKEFVAAVQNEEEYNNYKNALHPLHLLLDVEAQKQDLIALEKCENYLGSITHQFNIIINNQNLDEKVKEQFLKNAEKFSKYYERYNENFEEVENEAKGKNFQEGSKEYNSYLLENVFKNRKHKLPEKLDGMPFERFKEIYEKYYVDDDLDVFSQEFWEIKNYTRGFNKVKLSEEVWRFMNYLNPRLLEKAEREIPGIEDITDRINCSNFEDLKFDKEKKEVFLEIEGKKISFLNICKMYVLDDPYTEEALALIPFCNLIDLTRLQYIWVSIKIKEEGFNFDLKNVYKKNINNIENEDVKNYFNNQLEKMKDMFEQYKKENENARKLADETRESGELKSNYDYNKYVEKLIFEGWNNLFLKDLGIEDVKDLTKEDKLIKTVNNFDKIDDNFNLDD